MILSVPNDAVHRMPFKRRPVVVFLVWLLAGWVGRSLGDDAVSGAESYDRARALHREAPDDAGRAWRYARACFDRAETLSSKPVKVTLAKEGIEACRSILKSSPAQAPCHYYLALNLGILAQAQPWKALGWVREMERHLQDCRVLDPGFDHAGADRSLGMLYEECPPPPLGVGNRAKARSHLSKAVELAPGYPENRLLWIEFLVNHGETQAAIGELDKLEPLLTDARARFSGEPWAAAWKQWESRLRALKTQLAPPSKNPLIKP